jgi:hypothetical protein
MNGQQYISKLSTTLLFGIQVLLYNDFTVDVYTIGLGVQIKQIKHDFVVRYTCVQIRQIKHNFVVRYTCVQIRQIKHDVVVRYTCTCVQIRQIKHDFVVRYTCVQIRQIKHDFVVRYTCVQIRQIKHDFVVRYTCVQIRPIKHYWWPVCIDSTKQQQVVTYMSSRWRGPCVLTALNSNRWLHI